ncbi:hypothetical protein BBJ28_00006865 [Nothophytophthora sp. Chile5]|nr:hypothetical protein BBJ28_00006865 [Nothophytophthora sp. Chile5]
MCTRRPWSFHALALASGSMDVEIAAKRDLVTLLDADSTLTGWQQVCSFRVVGRSELEQLVRGEAAKIKRREEESKAEREGNEPTEVGESAAEVEGVPMTPTLLALAFQGLVSEDKRAFLTYQRTAEADVDRENEAASGNSPPYQPLSPSLGGEVARPEKAEGAHDASHTIDGGAGLDDNESDSDTADMAPVRVYLLLDYPVSLLEIGALLRLGEEGCAAQVDDGPETLPLLPLIDGVLLLADPSSVLATRSRLKSVATTLARNKAGSIAKITGIANDVVPQMPQAEASVFQTVNAVVKAFFEAAQVGGIEWSDFVFTNMRCGGDSPATRTAEELKNELLETVEAMATQKFAFKEWVASTKFCSIPSIAPDSDGGTDLLCAGYESVLRGVFPASVTVSTVLFAITEAVSKAPAPVSRSDAAFIPLNDEQDNQVDASISEEFIEYGDLVASRAASSRLCHEVLHAKGDPLYLSGGIHRVDDVERAMWKRCDLPGVGNEGRKAMPRIPQLSAPERSVRDTEFASFYASKHCSRSQVHLTRQLQQFEELLGSQWRGKLQPRAFIEPLTRAILPQRMTRVLLENTPAAYTSYHAPTDSLLLAYLTETAPGRMQSTSWTARDHVRHRPAFKDWQKEQLPTEDYLTPRTQAAAGACVPLSAAQLALVSNETWTVYPADHSVVRLYKTPRGLAWLTVYQHGYVIHLIWCLYRIANALTVVFAVTISFHRDAFGFRSVADEVHEGEAQVEAQAGGEAHKTGDSSPCPSNAGYVMQFVGSFRDDSQIHICEGKRRLSKKPDGFSTITVTNSFPNGLIVSACSDGSIVQRYVRTTSRLGEETAAPPKKRNCAVAGDEIELSTKAVNGAGSSAYDAEDYRVFYGKGSVLRVLQSGKEEVLLANGTVSVLHEGRRGEQPQDWRNPAGEDKHGQPPLTPTLTIDPETNALVERRPNGVVVVTFTNGARVTYHVDGTRMYSNAGNSHILVTKRDFADVCIDVEINVTAQRHASGERVAITKGGLRVRSVVNIYEGTRVEVSYNTNVTAHFNGRITTRKLSGLVIVAKDSGRVEYNPFHSTGLVSTENILDRKEDAERDVTSHNGVYYFDCRCGHFELCDNEQNQFCADLSGAEGAPPTVSVDLAGVVSDAEAARYEVDSIPAKAVINDPIQPHLFVLNGDGTGLEILRPQDVTDYTESAATGNQRDELVDALSATGTRRHVFLRQLNPTGDDSRQQLPPLFNDTKLQDEMRKLQRPVATAAKYLPDYFAELQSAPQQKQQFTVVRHIQQIQPLSGDELHEMHEAWAKWERWQDEREVNKERYKVVDPRQPELIAQEAAMQKKVMVAYKASRARKRMARQKAREMRVKAAKEQNASPHMETVHEGEEPQGEEDGDEDEDELGQFGSEMSDDDVDEATEVDDPMELLWSAFSQADTESRGLLTIAQSTCLPCC